MPFNQNVNFAQGLGMYSTLVDTWACRALVRILRTYLFRDD